LILDVEGQSVDLRLGLLLNVRLAEIIVVPNLDAVVLTTGHDVLSIEGEGESVDVVLVSLDGGDALQVLGPDLESAISANSGVVLVLLRSAVSDLGDPLSVVELVVRGGFSLGLDVPESEELFVTSGEDSAVVSGEADSLDFTFVLDELSDALGVSDVPQSEGLVPR